MVCHYGAGTAVVRLQEAFLKRLEIKRKSLTDPVIQESKAFKFFYVLVWVFVILLLIGIPIVWWGVIKKDHYRCQLKLASAVAPIKLSHAKTPAAPYLS